MVSARFLVIRFAIIVVTIYRKLGGYHGEKEDKIYV